MSALTTAKGDQKALRIDQQRNETPAEALAHALLRPTFQAAVTLVHYNKDFGEIGTNTLIADLRKQCELASNGNLARAEALLMTQAHTLDAIFNNLARLAALNMGENLPAVEMYLRLALKAQVQCRRNSRNSRGDQKPATGSFCPAGEHRARPAAGEQRTGSTRGTHARAGNRNPAEQTIGGAEWRTAGP